jgi:IMP dehydrogenase
MITVKDFQKAERKPNACKDEHGRLRVGAAVGAGAGNEERVDALVAAGVDVLLIDSSHGHSEGVLQRIRETRAKYPDLQIIGGNVATGAGARALAEAGCSAVKVGIGPGSICTTRIVTGVGVRRSPPFPTRLKRWKVPVFRLSPTAVSVSPAISPKRSLLALLP